MVGFYNDKRINLLEAVSIINTYESKEIET